MQATKTYIFDLCSNLPSLPFELYRTLVHMHGNSEITYVYQISSLRSNCEVSKNNLI